jgi:hypothetical protein
MSSPTVARLAPHATRKFTLPSMLAIRNNPLRIVRTIREVKQLKQDLDTRTEYVKENLWNQEVAK